MRVVDVRTSRHTSALREPFVTSRGSVTVLESLRLDVEVVLPDGATWWASGWATPRRLMAETLDSTEAVLRGPLTDVLAGTDLAEWEALLDRVAAAAPGHPAAKAAVDLAVHLLVARARGVTLPELLGAETDRVRTDVTVAVADARQVAVATGERLAAGFTTLKLKVGTGGAGVDVARATAAWEAAEGRATLRLDANGGWSRREAVTVVDALTSAGVAVELVEQPVAADDLDGMRWLRQRLPVPVVADESASTVALVRRIAEHGCADLVNLKTAKLGGIRPVLQARAVAEAAGLGCLVGTMMEAPAGVAASVAVAAALDPALVHDLDAAWWLQDPGELVPQARYRAPWVQYVGP